MPARSTLGTGFLIGTALIIALVVFHQSQAIEDLRADAGALRVAIQPLNTLQIEHETLRNLEPNEEEIKALQDDQAEAQRLEAEIDRIKREIAASPRPPVTASWVPHNRIDLTVLNTILEAARLGNTHQLIELLTLNSGDETEAAALFAKLPEKTREQYGDAKHLLASIVAVALFPPGTKGLKKISQSHSSEDGNSIALRLTLQGAAPSPEPAPIDCVLRRGADNRFFLLISPEMMAFYRQAVTAAVEKK